MRSIHVLGKAVTGWQVIPAGAADFEEVALVPAISSWPGSLGSARCREAAGQVAGTDGKREEIDDFTGLAPQNMSAQNAVRAFFHDERSLKFRVKREMTSTWYSSRRVRKHIQVTKCSVLNLSLLLPPPVALPGTTIQAPHLSGARVRKGVRIRRR